MIIDLGYSTKQVRVKNAVAAGKTDVTSDAVNLSQFLGVMFVTLIGAIVTGGSGTVKLQHSDDNSTWYDVAGSMVAYTDAAANAAVVHDVYRPQKAYLKVVITRADQNVTVDGIVAHLYQAHKLPTTTDTTVLSRVVLAGPASA